MVWVEIVAVRDSLPGDSEDDDGAPEDEVEPVPVIGDPLEPLTPVLRGTEESEKVSVNVKVEVEVEPVRGALLEVPVTGELKPLLKFGEGDVPIGPPAEAEYEYERVTVSVATIVEVETIPPFEGLAAVPWDDVEFAVTGEPSELLVEDGSVPLTPVPDDGE